MTNKHKNYIFIRRRKKIEKRILRQGYLSLSLFPFFFHSLTRPILFNVKTDITTNKQKNYLFPSRRSDFFFQNVAKERKGSYDNDISLSLSFRFFFTVLRVQFYLFNVKTDITTNKQKNYLFPSRCGNGHSEDEKKK